MDFTALINALGLENMPPADQRAMLETALRTLQNRMTLRLSQTLTEEQMQELEAANAQGAEAGQAALDRICPNYNQMYQEEIDKLKSEM
jgi:uncharacterized protein YcbK (DUF882 family)